MHSAASRAPMSLSFPGAGVLVFWQLGVLHRLRQRLDLCKMPLLGSSSGAVATALAASGACLQGAARRGTELFAELNIAGRPFGMIGVLGQLTRTWLQDTLPHDAAAKCSDGRATLLVTTLPLLRTRPISDFSCRADLIRVIMASSHIPVVLDWRMFVLAKGSACIDGGLWWLLQRSQQEYQNRAARQTLVVKPCDDRGLDALQKMRHSILARPTDIDCVAEMWGRGVEYADHLVALHAASLEAVIRPTPMAATAQGSSKLQA